MLADQSVEQRDEKTVDQSAQTKVYLMGLMTVFQKVDLKVSPRALVKEHQRGCQMDM